MPKLASALFCNWALLRNNYMATIFEGSLQVTVVGVLPLVTAELRYLGSETVTVDRGKPPSVILCEKKYE